MNDFNHLTAEEIAAMSLEEANAVIIQRNKEFYYWPCTVEEFTAFYALGVRDFAYANLRAANLSDANLSNANLSDANLSDANLSNANLSNANLRAANLSDANLSNANLSNANLRDANLSDANLSDANLSDANLRAANLRDANLSDANLSDANLSDANLSNANLRDANLSDANLSDANLRDANVNGTQGIWAITNIGSRYDTLKAWIWQGELMLNTGCQHGITVQEFRERLKNSNTTTQAEYEDAIQFFERRLARMKAAQS